MSVARQLMENGKAVHPFLGVGIVVARRVHVPAARRRGDTRACWSSRCSGRRRGEGGHPAGRRHRRARRRADRRRPSDLYAALRSHKMGDAVAGGGPAGRQARRRIQVTIGSDKDALEDVAPRALVRTRACRVNDVRSRGALRAYAAAVMKSRCAPVSAIRRRHRTVAWFAAHRLPWRCRNLGIHSPCLGIRSRPRSGHPGPTRDRYRTIRHPPRSRRSREKHRDRKTGTTAGTAADSGTARRARRPGGRRASNDGAARRRAGPRADAASASPRRSGGRGRPQGGQKLLAPRTADGVDQALGASPRPDPGGVPDYFGTTPNWAFSPPLRKFVDTLPGLGARQREQPRAVHPGRASPTRSPIPAPTTTRSSCGSTREQMHSDLPADDAARLRAGQQRHGRGRATTRSSPDPIHYLGPMIIATKDRPVRIKFTNKLPTGAGGDLFIPVDTTVMGAGMGPLGMDADADELHAEPRRRSTCTAAAPRGSATARRTSGSPRPARDTPYPEGRQRAERARTCPIPATGSHDLLLHQPAERAADVLPRPRLRHHPPERVRRRGRGLPDHGRRREQELVADGHHPGRPDPADHPGQDLRRRRRPIAHDRPDLELGHRTPDGIGRRRPATCGIPHVYMPAQNPSDLGRRERRWAAGTTARGSGRPRRTSRIRRSPNPYYDPINAPWEPPLMPGVRRTRRWPVEAFMDTPLVNGTAYPDADASSRRRTASAS